MSFQINKHSYGIFLRYFTVIIIMNGWMMDGQIYSLLDDLICWPDDLAFIFLGSHGFFLLKQKAD